MLPIMSIGRFCAKTSMKTVQRKLCSWMMSCRELTCRGKQYHSAHIHLTGSEPIGSPSDKEQTGDSTDLLTVIDSRLPVGWDELDTVRPGYTETVDIGWLGEEVIDLKGSA